MHDTKCNKYVVKSVFVTLSDGLLIFHDVKELDWRDVYRPDLSLLNEAHFENPDMQQLFLTGLIENLRDMDPDKENYQMRYVFAPTQNTETKGILNPRLKYVEFYKIKNLNELSKLYQFCQRKIA